MAPKPGWALPEVLSPCFHTLCRERIAPYGRAELGGVAKHGAPAAASDRTDD